MIFSAGEKRVTTMTTPPGKAGKVDRIRNFRGANVAMAIIYLQIDSYPVGMGGVGSAA